MVLAGSHRNAIKGLPQKIQNLEREKKKHRGVVDELVVPNRPMMGISSMFDDRSRKNLYFGEKRPNHLLPAGDYNIGAGQ